MELSKFKDYLLLNGRSFNTTLNYIARIQQVLTFTKEILTTETINSFLKDMQTKSKASTINAYVNAIKSYLIFIKQTDIILPKKLKEEKRLPENFDEKYLEEKIIPIIMATERKDYLRLKAIFYFLFYSGIRVGEIDNLKRIDFDLEQKQVKVYISKTKEERIVLFTEIAKDIIKEYFNSEPEEKNAFNMTSMAVKQKCYRMKEHFPEINFHPHLFRHSYAIFVLKKGIDIDNLRKLLGHHSITSTTRYSELNNAQIKELWNKKVEGKG